MRKHARNLLHAVSLIMLSLILTGCGGGTSGGNNLLPSDNDSQPPKSSQNQDKDSAATFSAIVEWDIPDTRENGEALDLSEIGGYELIYRKVDELLKPAIIITDQTRDRYELTGLSAGRYEVRIAAFDTDGLYSDFSEPAYADIGQ